MNDGVSRFLDLFRSKLLARFEPHHDVAAGAGLERERAPARADEFELPLALGEQRRKNGFDDHSPTLGMRILDVDAPPVQGRAQAFRAGRVDRKHVAQSDIVVVWHQAPLRN